MDNNFVNCTPHVVNVVNDEMEVILTLPRCETAPRLIQSTKEVDEIAGIAITETEFGEVENLPEFKYKTYLIVSRLILARYPNRSDLLVPNGIVRDGEGTIIGCSSFARN